MPSRLRIWKSEFFIPAVLGLACAVVPPRAALGATFDAFLDFQTTSNAAANAWSYWETTNRDVSSYFASLSLMGTVSVPCGAMGTACWFDATEYNLVLENSWGSTVDFPRSQVADGELSFFTRSGVTVIRFLAPTAGEYRLSGFFDGNSTSPEPSRSLVVLNGNVGAALLDITTTRPFGAVGPFDFALTLSAGDTLDFLSAGSPSHSNGMATGFNVTIDASQSVLTAPPTGALLLAGLAGLGWSRRRRT